MTDPTTKSELLAEMQRGYAAFEALLAPLSAEQLTTPGVNGEWSIKDMLAHIAVWQQRIADRLAAVARNEEPSLNPATISNDEEMDQFNAKTFIANRPRPLEQVWHDFRTSYQRLQAGVEAVSQNDLFDPQRFAWMKGDPLWQNVGGNSFWHYEEHTPMIENWLSQHKA